MASTFIPIIEVEDYINDRLLAASIEDAEGIITDPITHELIETPVFIGGRVWEANSIAQLRVNAINNERDFWIHPLSREKVSTHLNPLRYPPLTEAVKAIKEKISSLQQPLDQSQAASLQQAPVPGQAATAQGLHPFPSDLLKGEKGHSVLVNVLQLAKSFGWENTIGWGKRSSWFAEQFPGWFDTDQQGMFTR
jgi:hypothetical protein